VHFFQFCLTNGVDFLTVRVYIGLWLGIIGLVVVCFEGSVLVKLFTRFTEEIFAALISLLYIVESITKLFVVSVIISDFRIYCYTEGIHFVHNRKIMLICMFYVLSLLDAKIKQFL
jgi:HCO3- transporter family.